jgi:hypothetical protein
MPYRGSQRWSDDPPIGTIVLGNERVIYLGNGDWQPLANTSHPGEAAGQHRRGQANADGPISS